MVCREPVCDGLRVRSILGLSRPAYGCTDPGSPGPVTVEREGYGSGEWSRGRDSPLLKVAMQVALTNRQPEERCCSPQANLTALQISTTLASFADENLFADESLRGAKFELILVRAHRRRANDRQT